jgi:AcrR family transcriptional regulator
MSSLAAMREGRAAETLDRTVSAARRCFARDGVTRTTIGHVATEAGVARPTIYKIIASRAELLELVLTERLRELVLELDARGASATTTNVAEDLLEYMAVTVEVTRDDPEFNQVAGALPRERAFGFLSGSPALGAMLAQALSPHFDRAEREGLLRDIDRSQLAALVQIVMTPLAARLDLDAERLRTVLRQLLLPALLRRQ